MSLGQGKIRIKALEDLNLDRPTGEFAKLRLTQITVSQAHGP